MKHQPSVIILVLCCWLHLSLSAAPADSLLRQLEQNIALQQQKGDVDEEDKARWLRIVTLANNAQDSLLLAIAPEEMTWFMHHNKWEHYYNTWDSKANVYLYSNHVQTALREAQLMLSDADSRESSVGRAMAYQLMGIIYESMGQYKQAIEVFHKCIAQLHDDDPNSEMMTNAYDYLCQTLDESHRYEEELQVTKKMEEYINDKFGQQSHRQQTFYLILYFSKASALTGLGRYAEAEQMLRQAQQIQNQQQTPLGQYRIYYIYTRLMLAKGQAKQALTYLDSLTKMDIDAGGDLDFMRGDIYMQLARTGEAAGIFRKLYIDKDSVSIAR